MLKKILIASVTALGLAVPFTLTPAHADAAYYHRFGYEVMYRRCGEPWRVDARYESRHRAHEIAEHLRHRGFEVRVVERF
jgi:hypothetical protein